MRQRLGIVTAGLFGTALALYAAAAQPAPGPEPGPGGPAAAPQHGFRQNPATHGASPGAERGKTAPGSTRLSTAANGAEPASVQPPVPAPTVGATGGHKPYTR